MWSETLNLPDQYQTSGMTVYLAFSLPEPDPTDRYLTLCPSPRISIVAVTSTRPGRRLLLTDSPGMLRLPGTDAASKNRQWTLRLYIKALLPLPFPSFSNR